MNNLHTVCDRKTTVVCQDGHNHVVTVKAVHKLDVFIDDVPVGSICWGHPNASADANWGVPFTINNQLIDHDLKILNRDPDIDSEQLYDMFARCHFRDVDSALTALVTVDCRSLED